MDASAFEKLSYGVYIIASGCSDEKNAFVATTAFQVTSEPLQIAVACNKNNFTRTFIEIFKKFSVSVLKQDYTPSILGNFGYRTGRGVNKFDGIHYKLGPHTSVPIVLDDAVAWFECRLVNSIDVGSHILFIGEVVGAETLSDDTPLTYTYYREVKKGKAPKNAPHGVAVPKDEEPKVEKPLNNNIKSSTMKSYECSVCGYVYNPAEGDPDRGIAPGTPFEELPEDWTCPLCGVAKSDFEMKND